MKSFIFEEKNSKFQNHAHSLKDLCICLKTKQKKIEKVKIFIFRKITPNSFCKFEIGPKAICNIQGVIRSLFWPPTCIEMKNLKRGSF